MKQQMCARCGERPAVIYIQKWRAMSKAGGAFVFSAPGS